MYSVVKYQDIRLLPKTKRSVYSTKRLILIKSLSGKVPLCSIGGVSQECQPDHDLAHPAKTVPAWQQALLCCGTGQKPDADQTKQYP